MIQNVISIPVPTGRKNRKNIDPDASIKALDNMIKDDARKNQIEEAESIKLAKQFVTTVQ